MSQTTGDVIAMQSENTPEDNAAVYPQMEDIAAHVVDHLADFPGFDRRTFSLSMCDDKFKRGSEKVARLEIKYSFSKDDSKTQQVRVDYLDQMRQYMNDNGFQITRDDDRGGVDGYHSLVGTNSDGMKIWYRVMERVSLYVQSGCRPHNPDLVYIAPVGNVPVDSDTMRHHRRGPAPDPTEDAINPFSS